MVYLEKISQVSVAKVETCFVRLPNKVWRAKPFLARDVHRLGFVQIHDESKERAGTGRTKFGKTEQTTLLTLHPLCSTKEGLLYLL